MTEKVIRTNAKDVKMLAEKLKREGDISPKKSGSSETSLKKTGTSWISYRPSRTKK